MKTTLNNFALHILSGLAFILGGLFIYLLIAISIGYLPYSDQPGAGWHGVHLTWQGVKFILDFLVFLGIYVLGELVIVYWIFRLFRLIGYDYMVFRVFGCLVIGFLTAYLTLGIGWYIALDFSTVVACSVFGGSYGATLFPRYLK